MSKKEIFENLNKEINALIGDNCDLSESTKMKEIGLNSIDFVKLLVFSEEFFDILFSDDDLIISDSITFGDLIDKIYKYISEQS